MGSARKLRKLHAVASLTKPAISKDLPVKNETEILRGDARALAVAKFRDLANKLESGELDGARVQWRNGSPDMEVVEMDGHLDQPGERSVRLKQITLVGG